MRRVAFIVAGLILAGNSIFVAVLLWFDGPRLTLILAACPLLAGLALGVLLIVKNVRPEPPADEDEEDPTSPEEDS